MERSFDIIVVGGGHAGSEAAHAAAKLGLNTLLLTNNIDQIASMPCNPAIGGPAKSHLVKEIDALGGIMALAADATYMQLKTLNMSKGPAVRALRAQSDKKEYSNWVRMYLENTPNLTIYQSSAKALLFDKAISNNAQAQVIGLETNLDEKIFAKAVILTAGTFLEGRIFSGNKFENAGRAGEKASQGLSPNIQNLGLRIGRLKTGTPARLDRRTIDFSTLEEAPGDKEISHFSFLPNRPIRRQYLCHITRTNEKTHEIIMKNLMKSPMYSGEIDANGPRYCPSIEDKVVRFPHNPSHHFFLEPEGISSKEIYLQGCSTSLPIEVQWEIVRSLPGCENADIVRPAYAVEYDYFPGVQFKHNLEAKLIDGLFVAGQVLGTSGYEEAAAQGIIAGINAAQLIKGKEPFILDRASSYIGTLIDDLVTKEINDPYRMLTSRSEYRLLLRQDNADQRLTETGRKLGLVDDFRWKHFLEKQDRISKEIKFLNHAKIDLSNYMDAVDKDYQKKSEQLPEHIQRLTNKGSNKSTLADLLRRVDMNLSDIKDYTHISLSEKDIRRLKEKDFYVDSINYDFEVETQIKYEGYISRQMEQIKDTEKYEKIRIPESFDFKNCQQISLEAREKLDQVKPKNLGQASRVGGVTPNDISVLSILLESQRRKAFK